MKLCHFKCWRVKCSEAKRSSTRSDNCLTDSWRCPNWDCSSGCYYLHTEAHCKNVWELLLIMLSVTNQPWPLSPQDTHVQTYGCDDNFWRIYRYRQPFRPLSLWCVDLSTPAGTVCVLNCTKATASDSIESRLKASKVWGHIAFSIICVVWCSICRLFSFALAYVTDSSADGVDSLLVETAASSWRGIIWGVLCRVQTTRYFCLLKCSLCWIRQLKSHKFLPCCGRETWRTRCSLTNHGLQFMMCMT